MPGLSNVNGLPISDWQVTGEPFGIPKPWQLLGVFLPIDHLTQLGWRRR